MEDFRINFSCSINSHMFSNPYSYASGLRIVEKHEMIFKKNTSLSFDICDGLKAYGIDLRMLFPGEKEAYHSSSLIFNKRSGTSGPPFPGLDNDVELPYIPLTLNGVYFRSVISFLSHGVRYHHVLSGALAFGFPDPSDQKMTKAMWVIDGLFKQELSQLRLQSGIEYVRIPQYVYCGDDLYKDIKALDPFATTDKEYSITFADKAGNNSGAILWQSEANDRYYYNLYAMMESVKKGSKAGQSYGNTGVTH